MMTLFDYIYYRWYRLYAKKDINPDIYASGIVTVYQGITAINLISLVFILAGIKRPDVKYIIPIFLILILINYFRYERGINLSQLDKRWQDEPKKKKQRNWILLIAYLVVNFMIPWIYGFSTN